MIRWQWHDTRTNDEKLLVEVENDIVDFSHEAMRAAFERLDTFERLDNESIESYMNQMER